MPSHIHSSGSTESSSTTLTWILEGLLLGLLAYLPFAFGGIWPFSQMFMIGGTGTALAIFALRCWLVPRHGLTWNWAFTAALGFMGLVALQALPIPQGVLGVLSPNAAKAWHEGGRSGFLSASLYPHATGIDLRLALCAMGILIVGGQLYRDPKAITRLLWSMALIGSGVMLVTLVQMGLGMDKIYGVWESPNSSLAGGTFVHPGHLSQFLNLTIGAAIGLVLIRARLRNESGQLDVGQLLAKPGQGIGWLERMLVVVLGAAALCVLVSGSRNGVISMIFAGSVCVLLMQKRGVMVGIGWSAVGVLFATFVGLLFFGFDPIHERFSALGLDDSSGSIRLDLLRDSLAMWLAFPLMGAGLGTYGVTFPPFDRAARGGYAEHAENQYAEFLAETGVLGMAALVALMVMVFVAFAKGSREVGRPVGLGRFGLGFGLMAVAFHGLTDFGIKTPAITVGCMLYAGALLGGTGRLMEGRRARLVAGVGSLVAAGLLFASLPEAIRHWKAELHWDAVSIADGEISRPHFRTTEEKYERLLAHARRAVELQPGDIEKRYDTLIYEWHAAVAAADGYETDKDLIRNVRTAELEEKAASIRDRLLDARRYAPWYGRLYTAAGQLGVVWLDDPAGPDLIRRGSELSPHRPEAWLAMGMQHLRDGQGEEALAAYRHAVQVGGSTGEVLDALVVDHGRPDLALEFAGEDMGLLNQLEGRLRKYAPEEQEMIQTVGERVIVQLEKAVQDGRVETWMLRRLAQVSTQQGDAEKAIGYWKSFLLRDPRSQHRYDLAVLLTDAGKSQEARRQIRDLLEMHPGHGRGKALLETLLGASD